MAGFHPMDMVSVCPTCLEASKTYHYDINQLRSTGCLDPQTHDGGRDHENWSLTVINETSGIVHLLCI